MSSQDIISNALDGTRLPYQDFVPTLDNQMLNPTTGQIYDIKTIGSPSLNSPAINPPNALYSASAIENNVSVLDKLKDKLAEDGIPEDKQKEIIAKLEQSAIRAKNNSIERG